MRTKTRLFVFIFLFSFFQFFPKVIAATTELPFPDPDKTISLDFQDASLKNILKIFSIQSGLNFIASDAVQDKKMTLYFDKVPIKEAMDKLFKANNLYYELDKKSNIFIVKDWGKAEVDTITKIYRLKYQSVPSASMVKEKSDVSQATAGADLYAAIKQRLSEYGKLSEDAVTNSLIITDIPSRFPLIEQLIASLDVPEPQVMLEMEVLDVSKNKVDTIGFKFGQTPFTAIVTGATATMGFPYKSWSKILDPNLGSLSINPSTATYQMQMDFLRTQTDTKTLARPKILTMNNETAEIKITTKEATNASTTTNTEVSTSTSGVDRYEVGVTLRVTPQINPDTGDITMYLAPIVSATKTGITVGNTTVKDPEERSSKSLVRVKDGETVIIGGLIQYDYDEVITKLPFFGDLPLIGSFFRHKNKDKDRERELLIFITPHIVKEGKIDLAQAKKISIPEREQSTAIGIDRRRIIETSLNSFDRKK
ncbi:MAG: secretin N-terminal domain-containing protein [Candidatus Omnitrophica bacterium]|nr:secretin N-terminal domain-containing protein [Candidatus Omnitrophota bacterium]